MKPCPASDSSSLKPHPLLGNLLHFIRNRHKMVEWTTGLINGSPTGTVTVAPFVVTANPSNFEHVLKSRFSNYNKSRIVLAAFHDFLGDGILNTEGDLWLLQRKNATYEFNTKTLRSFVVDSVGDKIVRRLVPLLKAADFENQIVDLRDVFQRFAFDNVCALVLGHDPGCLGSDSGEGMEFYHSFEDACALSVDRLVIGLPLVWRLRKLLRCAAERRMEVSVNFIRRYIMRLVRQRRKTTPLGDGGSNDFLSRLLKHGQHTDELLCDIIIGFLMAGSDTTPSALTWFFWELRRRPDITAKIRDEIASTRRSRGSNIGDVLTLEELREMHYLHAALSESMRLHPPVPLVPKWCLADDVLPDGTPVRRGWQVFCSVHAMGRMTSVWGEDSEEMKPERWQDENGTFRPASPFKYPVFLAGPRMCMGKDMAYIQMKAVVASVLEEFDFEVVGERGEYQMGVTVKIKHGLPVKIRERK